MKRKSVGFKILSLMLITVLTHVSPLFAQDKADAVTHGDFAVYLVRALGIEADLPMGAKKVDYLQLLERQGIVPSEGSYEVSKQLSKADLAFLMVRATGMENRVLNTLMNEKLVKEEKAVIVKMNGSVSFRRGLRGSYAKAEAKDELFLEDGLKTGKNSSAEIKIGQYSAAVVSANSEIVFEELAIRGNQKENVRIYVKKGEMIVTVKGDADRVNFETHTDTTVAVVTGTVFSISSVDGQDKVSSLSGSVKTYSIDPAGKPISDPKMLSEGNQVVFGSDRKSDAVFASIDLQDPFFMGLSDKAKGVGSYITPPSATEMMAGNAQAGTSSFDARQQLAKGSKEALKAALEELSKDGVIIETTGVADAVNSTITQTQLSQWIGDLLLSPTIHDYNTPVTPIGIAAPFMPPR